MFTRSSQLFVYISEKYQLFVYKFRMNISWLFTFWKWTSTVCLHFENEYQLFVYNFKGQVSCLFVFWKAKSVDCLHYLKISAVCLHFLKYYLVVHILRMNLNISCLFRILKVKSAVYLQKYSLELQFICMSRFKIV